MLLSPIVCLLPHFLTSFSCSTSRRQIRSYSVTSLHRHEPKCLRYVSSTDLNLSRRIKAVMKINGLQCHGSKVYPIKLIYVSLGCHQCWLSAASLLSVMFTRLNMPHWTLQHLIKAQLHWCNTLCKNYEDKHIWKSTFLWKTNLWSWGDRGCLMHVETLVQAVKNCSSAALRPAGHRHIKAFSPVPRVNPTS